MQPLTRSNKLFWTIALILFVVAVIGGTRLIVHDGKTQQVEIVLRQTPTHQYKGEIIVDGAVSCPGTYKYDTGDTIQDLLVCCGPTSYADLAHLTLHVPAKTESNLCQRIDINNAELWLLKALPGIGETLAQAIIDYREDNGRFKCIEDICMVDGIGLKTFENIQNYITINE